MKTKANFKRNKALQLLDDLNPASHLRERERKRDFPFENWNNLEGAPKERHYTRRFLPAFWRREVLAGVAWPPVPLHYTIRVYRKYSFRFYKLQERKPPPLENSLLIPPPKRLPTPLSLHHIDSFQSQKVNEEEGK